MTAHELRFGISRKHGGDRVLEAARLFTDVVAAALKTRVKLLVSFDYEHLLKTVTGGGVELAWLPPLIYAQAQSRGTMPFAVCSRSGRLTYRSAILVREDSHYRVPADLKGARVAWTDRHSAAGCIFPRLHLQKLGLDPQHDLKESYAGSMVQAAAAVDRNEADACAAFVDKTDPEEMRVDIRRVFGPKMRELRVLENGVTDAIPADGVAVCGNFPGEEKTRITDALCNLHRSKDGATALQELMQADCLVRPPPELLKSLEALLPILAS